MTSHPLILWLAQESPSAPQGVAWTAIVIATLSTVGAIAASIVAARSASRTKVLEIETARLAEVQRRVETPREELYTDYIEMWRQMFRTARGKSPPPEPTESMIDTMSRFATWVQIYGSDDAVRKAHKLQQSVHSAAPSQIMIRFFAELMLAARRDLGDERTSVDPVDLMGLLLNDLYRGYEEIFAMPEQELFRQYEWEPPWGDRYDVRKGRAGEPIFSTGGLSLLSRPGERKARSRAASLIGSGGLGLISKPRERP